MTSVSIGNNQLLVSGDHLSNVSAPQSVVSTPPLSSFEVAKTLLHGYKTPASEDITKERMRQCSAVVAVSMPEPEFRAVVLALLLSVFKLVVTKKHKPCPQADLFQAAGCPPTILPPFEFNSLIKDWGQREWGDQWLQHLALFYPGKTQLPFAWNNTKVNGSKFNRVELCNFIYVMNFYFPFALARALESIVNHQLSVVSSSSTWTTGHWRLMDHAIRELRQGRSIEIEFNYHRYQTNDTVDTKESTTADENDLQFYQQERAPLEYMKTTVRVVKLLITLLGVVPDHALMMLTVHACRNDTTFKGFTVDKQFHAFFLQTERLLRLIPPNQVLDMQRTLRSSLIQQLPSLTPENMLATWEEGGKEVMQARGRRHNLPLDWKVATDPSKWATQIQSMITNMDPTRFQSITEPLLPVNTLLFPQRNLKTATLYSTMRAHYQLHNLIRDDDMLRTLIYSVNSELDKSVLSMKQAPVAAPIPSSSNQCNRTSHNSQATAVTTTQTSTSSVGHIQYQHQRQSTVLGNNSSTLHHGPNEMDLSLGLDLNNSAIGNCVDALTSDHRQQAGINPFQVDCPSVAVAPHELGSFEFDDLPSFESSSTSLFDSNGSPSFGSSSASLSDSNGSPSFGSSGLSLFGSSGFHSFGSNDLSWLGSNDLSSLESNGLSSLGSNGLSSLGSNELPSLGSTGLYSLGSNDWESPAYSTADNNWSQPSITNLGNSAVNNSFTATSTTSQSSIIQESSTYNTANNIWNQPSTTNLVSGTTNSSFTSTSTTQQHNNQQSCTMQVSANHTDTVTVEDLETIDRYNQRTSTPLRQSQKRPAADTTVPYEPPRKKARPTMANYQSTTTTNTDQRVECRETATNRVIFSVTTTCLRETVSFLQEQRGQHDSAEFANVVKRAYQQEPHFASLLIDEINKSKC
jgi:hypothetical protein